MLDYIVLQLRQGRRGGLIGRAANGKVFVFKGERDLARKVHAGQWLLAPVDVTDPDTSYLSPWRPCRPYLHIGTGPELVVVDADDRAEAEFEIERRVRELLRDDAAAYRRVRAGLAAARQK